MTVRFAIQTEIDNWDKLLIADSNGGSVFQTREFADIKGANHWIPRFVMIDQTCILILERKVSLLGKYWYVPKGPCIKSVTELEQIIPQLKTFAKTCGVFTIKLEPELIETPETIKQLTNIGLQKSRAVQAANTVIVDLVKPLDQIMAGFSSKIRGHIRAAQNVGVTCQVVPANDENCKLFYDLMSATIGGRSYVRGFDYFKNFWQTYEKSGNGIFMFAYADNQIVAMDFIMALGTKAARKDAASDRNHSVRGATALLELDAIKYLKEHGITEYDLYGSPPSDQIKNPDHPFYGFGTFKAGFNDQITDYVGCYNLIVKPFAFNIWRKFGERITEKLYRTRHHDVYY